MPLRENGLLKDLFILAFLIVVIVVPVRTFVISPFIVDGESMHPTFENLNYLIIDEISYRFKEPERGDVIVFRYPKNPSLFYIKRIVGLPGETVSIRHGEVFVTKSGGDAVSLSEPYVTKEDATYNGNSTLGKDEYFVMGDNRPNSSDSRTWGQLHKENIVGRVFIRLLPINDAELFPGQTTFTSSSTSSLGKLHYQLVTTS